MIQKELQGLGFFSPYVSITGYFGPITQSAVERFQADNNLSITGNVNQDTWSKINEAYAATDKSVVTMFKQSLPVPFTFTKALSIGSRGEEVKMLQKELQGLGFFSLSVSLTGYFGPITQEAVELFQAANGIEAIGIVGPKTRAVLNTL